MYSRYAGTAVGRSTWAALRCSASEQAPHRLLRLRSFADIASQQTRTPLLHKTSPSSSQGDRDDQRGVGAVLFAFFGGFAGTVLFMSLTSKAQAPSRLLPNRYDLFGLFDVQRCTSPSDKVGQDDGEHVYLSIETPYYVAPPKLHKEHLESAASGKPLWRILSVYMKEPSLQIERPYTPLYADAITGPRGRGPIELMIKRYPDGELGRYAHRLQKGQGVELRGPEVTWQGPQTNHLVMIVGGTGITPAYQLITSILGHPDRPFPPGIVPRISLLYGASKPSSLLLLPELQKLQQVYGERLHVELFCDQVDPSGNVSWLDWLRGKRKMVEDFPMQTGRIDERSVREALNRHKSNSRRVLVCGPEAMVAHVAGAKVDGRQGELGGILQRIGCKDDEVWKL